MCVRVFFPFFGYDLLTLLFSCCHFCIGITTFLQKCKNVTTSTTWLIVNPSCVGVVAFLSWCYYLPTLMVVLFSHVGVGGVAFPCWHYCLLTLVVLPSCSGVVAFPTFVLLLLSHRYYYPCVVLLPLSHWSCCFSHVLLLFFLHWCCCFFRVGVIILFMLMLNVQAFTNTTFVVTLFVLVWFLFPWLVWYFPPSYLV